jgi:small subunit ribosomal protein S11
MKNHIIKLDVKCTSNNTILHASKPENKNIVISTGLAGFKGAKRSTPYAAQQAAEIMGTKLLESKTNKIILCFNGVGKNKKSIVKGLRKKKILIMKIIDKTQVPHNGCRPPKKRKL